MLDKKIIINEICKLLNKKPLPFLRFIESFLRKNTKTKNVFLFMAKDKYDVQQYKQFLKINKIRNKLKRELFNQSDLDLKKIQVFENELKKIDEILQKLERKSNEF